ncbi:MAG TPA: DUF5722 domain-containing protein, partial [Tepidisphaeraceae bacterium]|nr:DUF5722 domain-containing protein [Tepidisphaeraceae bacterium]
MERSFPQVIQAISLDGNQIRIEGQLAASARDVQLAQVGMWEDVTDLVGPREMLPIEADGSGHFVKVIERTAPDGADRLLSGWVLARRDGERCEPVSAMHYIESETARAALPAAPARPLKGLCGCPMDSPDVKELGVQSITLNIVLNQLLFPTSAPGRTEYRYGDRTWYVADRAVARYDRSLKLAADHGCMVSAIILLSPVRDSPADAWIRLAAHPDADPKAAYVMPNFTTRAGVQAYAAAMNFLAERYSRPDGKFGRIHHWILHNEISSGFYWTSAGDKTLLTYLDLYQKSLRLTCLIARHYDPHTRPLISLEHSWTHNPEKHGYPGRELLEQLVRFSRREGDFEWGIAYHPYAQDLRNPRTWEDPQATFRFDTPFITFKNLEVLDAWVRQPRVSFQGHPRDVQLSEEGLNSRDYSEKALQEEAAGLAYAWKKIVPLKTISAFQYHRWSDARAEGGLRLGLRKFSDEPGDPLGKKPA